MKRFIAIMLCVSTFLLLVSCGAVSEGEKTDEWTCPGCGRINRGNFCPDCGTKKPVWVCPLCGYENFSAFCENCGAARPETTDTRFGNTPSDELPSSDPFIAVTGLVRNDGGSMEQTIEAGEVVLTDPFDYGSDWLCQASDSNNEIEAAPRKVFGTPGLLDVVVCRYPGRGSVLFIKRIVGMPGDTVALENGYLVLNGEPVPEEREVEGITAEYRRGSRPFAAYYVPKKGDSVVVSKSLQSDNAFTLTINGEKWTRTRERLVIRADGKTLIIYERNTDDSSRENQEYVQDEKTGTYRQAIVTETVFSYDGKIYTPAEFFRTYPKLLDTELTIDEDYYFVMGDHRNNSNDSRSIGALERSAIIRHVTMVVSPLNRQRKIR